MQKYVAFITGLPFGGGQSDHEEIRLLFMRLGFSNVETLHSRDTVLFETAPVGVIGPLEAQISRHLKRSLDLEHCWTFIRTPSELESIVKAAPFPVGDKEGDLSFVVLLSEEPDYRAARELKIRRSDADELVPEGKHIYWLRHASAEAGPPPSLSEIIDAPATVRSLRTLSRIAERHSPAAPRRSPKSANGDATESARSRH